MKRMVLQLVLVVSAVLTLIAATLPGVAAAAEYPGGKRIYAVTLGQVPQSTPPTGREFVRLAMYYFNGDGSVREAFWFWSWNQNSPAANIRATSTGCDGPCQIRTAGGFQTGAEVKSLTGRYTTNGSQLSITWDGGATETWAVTTPAEGISAISLTGSNYGANVGQGYGSNASSDTAVPLDEVPRATYRGRYAHNFYDQTTGTLRSDSRPSELDLAAPGWSQCNGNCLSAAFPASANACTACGPGQQRVVRYYIATEGGRKNYIEHFCTCLRQDGSNPCYAGGSHLKPQLQVIDDGGRLRGWVGIEASHRVAQRGTLGVHWHVAL